MPRTKRSQSASTSPTVEDSNDAGFIDEKNILKPTDEGSDPDGWNCFLLSEATVYSCDGQGMANLLLAELEGPLMVRGTLKLTTKAQKSRLLVSGSTHRIQLNAVIGFSMGDSKDTSDPNAHTVPVLWAKGDAGWFELRAAQGYKNVYDEMMEGITLYYFFVDLYENAEETLGSKRGDMRSIYRQYAQIIGPTSISDDVVSKILLRHASFLISQMRKDTQFVSWRKKAIFEWLIYNQKDIYQRYIDNDAKDAAAGRKIIDFKVVTTEPVSEGGGAIEAGTPQNDIIHIAPTTIQNSTGKSNPTPPTLRPRGWPSSSRSSVSVEEIAKPEAAPSIVEETASVFTVPMSPEPATQGRNTRSRRTAGKHAGLRPTPLRRQLSPAAYENDVANYLPSTKRLRLSPPVDDSDSQTEEAEEVEDDNDEEAEGIEDDDESIEEDTNPYNDYRDSDYAHELPLSKVELHILTSAIPSTQPTGPRGIWSCPESDCTYEVAGADKPKGKSLIHTHFLEHADETAYREHLVLTEGQRECLPVNHLLEKIRAMGEKARNTEESERKVINGRFVPVPIRGKLQL